MPNRSHPGAGGDVNAAMKTIMDQAVTDDMFKAMNQRPLVWENELPAPEEAKSFNDKGPQTRPDDAKTSESGDAVPQFQQVALASPETAGQTVYSATADVIEAAHADSDVQVAQGDAGHPALHDPGMDTHSADSAVGQDLAVAHPVEASASVGEEAAV